MKLKIVIYISMKRVWWAGFGARFLSINGGKSVMRSNTTYAHNKTQLVNAILLPDKGMLELIILV